MPDAIDDGPGEEVALSGLQGQLDQLGAKSAVDDEFARLKAEVDSGTPAPGLPAGDPDGAAPEEADA